MRCDGHRWLRYPEFECHIHAGSWRVGCYGNPNPGSSSSHADPALPFGSDDAELVPKTAPGCPLPGGPETAAPDRAAAFELPALPSRNVCSAHPATQKSLTTTSCITRPLQ